jgi:hypothetical protein
MVACMPDGDSLEMEQLRTLVYVGVGGISCVLLQLRDGLRGITIKSAAGVPAAALEAADQQHSSGLGA